MSSISLPTVSITQGAPNQPAVWAIDGSAQMNARPIFVDGLEARASRAHATGEASGLLMVLAEAIEFGHHRIAGQVARASLELNMRELPGVGAGRLHAMAIAGGVATDVATVADLAQVADQLRNSAVMHEIGFGLTSARLDPNSLARSLQDAAEKANSLADSLERVAGGSPMQLVPLIRELSFFGLLNIARGLAQVTTFGTGAAYLDVAIAAQVRHRVGAGRGLQAQLEIIEHSPGSTAARNSACACLVDLGMAEAGLDHLAVSLLRPDHYVGNTGRRALREAGYEDLAALADEIADVMKDLRPHEAPLRVAVLAAEILSGIRRRTATELAMLNLVGRIPAVQILEERARVDAATASAAR